MATLLCATLGAWLARTGVWAKLGRLVRSSASQNRVS